MKAVLKRFIKDESGLETVEYAIITALIVAGSIAVLGTIGVRVFNTFTTVETALGAANMGT
jgi:Flp pilus assembly pilin Flp